MNDTGLSQLQMEQILGVLARYPAVTSALLFGSRAKGTASPSSDVDLALEGVTDPLQLEAIASELDELPLPYRFDVVALATLKSEPLREHILREGIRIYGRE